MAEVAPLLLFLEGPEDISQNHVFHLHHRHHQIHILITGVGMLFTAFQLGKQLTLDNYNLVINAGVAGAIDRKIALGATVQVVQDEIYDFGAEDGHSFLTIEQLGLITSHDQPYTAQGVINKAAQWPLIDTLMQVRAHTVNRVHGSKESIQKMEARSKAQVESMEGAAFLYACIKMNIPCVQIRSISNYVEVRNKSNWRMKEAIENLNQWLIKFINHV